MNIQLIGGRIALGGVTSVTVMMTALFPVLSAAQGITDKNPYDEKVAENTKDRSPGEANESEAATAKEDELSTDERLSILERKFEAQDEEIRSLNAQAAEKDAALAFFTEDLANSENYEGALDEETDSLFFWGFYDLTFAKRIYEKGSLYNIYTFSGSSFILTGVNLYLKSQLTDTFSVLLETSVSFLPGVQDEELEYTGLESEYRRRNVLVTQPFTTEELSLGGIGIERLHLSWNPKDWFNVLAGRFLTPFGIWNIDHGSPVLLTILQPYFQMREMVVKAQTGMQIFGRFLPTSKIYLDYAITLSNGRGPTEAVFDLDENKAVGVRLHLTYDNMKVRFSAGGYGYVGTKTDRKKVVSITDNDKKPIRVDMVDVSRAWEYALTADAKLNLYGLMLQSEYVWRRIDFDVTYQMRSEWVLLKGGTISDALAEEEQNMWFVPSYTGYSVYILLGYTLPLEKLIGAVLITPYVYFERNASFDFIRFANLRFFRAGINMKPTTFLTLKLEYAIQIAETDAYGTNINNVALQMAVTF